MVLMYFFFFFKQKTAYELRISDWSSDVCSSDLAAAHSALPVRLCRRRRQRRGNAAPQCRRPRGRRAAPAGAEGCREHRPVRDAVRAQADRKSVVTGQSVVVRVDIGGRRTIKTTNKPNHILKSLHSSALSI